MKLLVVKNISTKNNKEYNAVVIDLGYERKYLSFDTLLCMKLLNMTPTEYNALSVGEYIIMKKGE